MAVHLRDALKLMGERLPNGTMRPFSLQAYTYNRKSREGGRKLELTDAVLLTKDALPSPVPFRARKRKALDKRRHPDHFATSTRNLRMPAGDVVKVNIWLITHFNGEPVHY